MSEPALGPVPRRFELSLSQERFWMLDRLEPGHPAFSVLAAWRLRGPLDPAVLRGALGDLVERHEILRTTFGAEEGEPFQRLAPPFLPPLPVVDLSSCPGAEVAVDRVARQAVRPFDLSRLPLFRALLLRSGAGEHVLVLAIHHILWDAWSARVFLDDLFVLYDARRHGRPSPLPPLQVQSIDFAHWQRRRFRTGAAAEPGMAFWLTALADLPAGLELPTDRPRPARRSWRGGRVDAAVPAALADRLRLVARREGVSLFTLLLAAFAALLRHGSGQDDLVVGTPVANRGRPELEPLIGCFINTLPLRLRLDPARPGRDLIRAADDAARGAFAHQEVPFEALLERLRPERDRSRSPLFQAMLAFDNTSPAVPSLGEASVETLPVDDGTTLYDLTLNLEDTGRGLTGNLEYDTDLFTRSTALRLARQLRRGLEALCEDLSRSLASWFLPSPEERHQVELEWNDTAASVAPEGCLHHLIEARARETPDALAVIDENGARLTYGELDRRAARVSRLLRSLGAGAERPVGILAERSAATVAALVGILKAGAAWVPLAPDLPRERLARIASEAGIALALTPGPRTPVVGCRWVDPDADPEVPAGEGDGGPPPDALAYVLFTSGSTGRPKGVGVPHRAVVRHLTAAAVQLGLSRRDVVLSVAALTFDISVLEVFLPLATGACLVLAGSDTILDGTRLQSAIERYGVTLMQAVPSQWELFLATGWRGAPDLRAVCGGEPLSSALRDALLPRVGRLWHMYGPTETVIWSTAGAVAPEEPVTLGRPVAGTRVLVLDRDLAPVPLGAQGEVVIAGEGLARGYVGQPALTAERFVPCPAGGAPGDRAFRTRDLVQLLPDGRLRFLGRLDEEVKIRGMRVVPGEVEAALRLHPGVRQAAVTALAGGVGEARLVAYVVPREGRRLASGELRQHLAAHLPEPMIPAAFVVLPALPMTPHGKVDRRALPPPPEPPALLEEGESPRGPIEEALAAVWCRLLGLPRVGVLERFFDIGGTSRLAVRLLFEIRAALRVDLPLRVLFEAPTIRGLAAIAAGKGGRRSLGPAVVPLRPEGTGPPLFLIHPSGGLAHCYLELVRRLEPRRPVYGIQQSGVDGEGPLHGSVEEMAERYLEEIRPLWSEGSALAGWSFGGLVAFEMARQLAARGEPAPLTVLLDTRAPGMIGRPPGSAEVVAFLAGQLERIFGVGLDVREEELSGLDPDRQIDLAAARMARHGIAGSEAEARRDLARFVALHRTCEGAAARYRPTPPGLDLLLVRGTEAGPGEPEDYGWRGATRGHLEIGTVPGDHRTILEEPNVAELAALLSSRLDRTASAALSREARP